MYLGWNMFNHLNISSYTSENIKIFQIIFFIFVYGGESYQ